MDGLHELSFLPVLLLVFQFWRLCMPALVLHRNSVHAGTSVSFIVFCQFNLFWSIAASTVGKKVGACRLSGYRLSFRLRTNLVCSSWLPVCSSLCFANSETWLSIVSQPYIKGTKSLTFALILTDCNIRRRLVCKATVTLFCISLYLSLVCAAQIQSHRYNRSSRAKASPYKVVDGIICKKISVEVRIT